MNHSIASSHLLNFSSNIALLIKHTSSGAMLIAWPYLIKETLK